ncbi:uncharacterized protein MONOS_8386 [Monocercomonoides exilis]|uniref:uncharacterized protein n=1 Tax=Monocercomonoides exilis TaxID=2049356 RepID=UPI0035596319|nr:hypothetical protein MONOS_8386 [Monocercomonoides exilis]|eukprot:MONOS_8386.1-p1 / transcript=MONOS_8386.1 / gene=MONOS_8386 / organism=Monocercomonoides_exilis_PA203 / gene_product=unspecified product / transcript_product=unspecified product / location=Mono_scaffold00315:11044-12255(+) / protein_length=293 / sequence_SO=supercontig / SO=protein_coding / is_pseudo=false
MEDVVQSPAAIELAVLEEREEAEEGEKGGKRGEEKGEEDGGKDGGREGGDGNEEKGGYPTAHREFVERIKENQGKLEEAIAPLVVEALGLSGLRFVKADAEVGADQQHSVEPEKRTTKGRRRRKEKGRRGRAKAEELKTRCCLIWWRADDLCADAKGERVDNEAVHCRWAVGDDAGRAEDAAAKKSCSVENQRTETQQKHNTEEAVVSGAVRDSGAICNSGVAWMKHTIEEDLADKFCELVERFMYIAEEHEPVCVKVKFTTEKGIEASRQIREGAEVGDVKKILTNCAVTT